MATAVENIKARGEALRKNAEARRAQARKEIDPKYHGFIIDLDQKVKLADFEAEAFKNAPGFAVYGGKTYAETSLPYVAVDGRVRMAVDEGGTLDVSFETAWTREAKELLSAASLHGILDGEAVKTLLSNIPEQLKGILTCTVVSSKHGRVEGQAKIGWDGSGVDRTNPIENAATSAVGRALGFMGYGLLGGGIASYEEVKAAVSEQERLDSRPPVSPAPAPKPAPPPAEEPRPPQNPEMFARPAESPVQNGPTPTQPATAPQPTPAANETDLAFQQTEGPCADCGGEMAKTMQSYVRNNRKKGKAVRYSHLSIPGGEKGQLCKKAAS